MRTKFSNVVEYVDGIFDYTVQMEVGYTEGDSFIYYWQKSVELHFIETCEPTVALTGNVVPSHILEN